MSIKVVVMTKIYLLLFEDDKICSLVLGQYKIILLFESEDQAYRYGLSLKVQRLPQATVRSVEITDVINYARTTGYSFKIIPQGNLVTPSREKIELIEWFTSATFDRLSKIYILLFNLGKDNEGVHSLKIANYDIVLLFEEEDDATRYSLLLEAQDFPTPTVERMYIEDAIESCASSGHAWQIIKKEGLTVPPELNIQQTEWQEQSQENEKDPTEQNLEDIRRKLEGLL
jgi:uncharacterized protein with GYD domain